MTLVRNRRFAAILVSRRLVLAGILVAAINSVAQTNEMAKPSGFAQAWSVAEILRAYIEDIKAMAPSDNRVKAS